MFELGVQDFKALRDFKNEKVTAESKPCLLFSGQGFEASDEMRRLKTMLIDLFRGPEVRSYRLVQYSHVLQCCSCLQKVDSTFGTY
jgi:ribosome production factor 2